MDALDFIDRFVREHEIYTVPPYLVDDRVPARADRGDERGRGRNDTTTSKSSRTENP